MIFVRKFLILSAFLVLAGPFTPALAQESVGSIVLGSGEIAVIRAGGGEEPAGVGTPVYQYDSIFVGPDSEASIRFVDQTVLSLGPESMLVIDELVYDPAGQNSSASFDLAGGLMGLVSGDIVKTGNMLVTTPVSTIGIRGTTALIDSGTIVVRTGASYSMQTSGTQGEIITLALSADGTLGTINIITASGDVFTLDSAGQTLQITPSGVEIFNQPPADIQQKFSRLAAALAAATGNLEDDAEVLEALQDLIDATENPAQDASPD